MPLAFPQGRQVIVNSTFYSRIVATFTLQKRFFSTKMTKVLGGEILTQRNLQIETLKHAYSLETCQIFAREYYLDKEVLFKDVNKGVVNKGVVNKGVVNKEVVNKGVK